MSLPELRPGRDPRRPASPASPELRERVLALAAAAPAPPRAAGAALAAARARRRAGVRRRWAGRRARRRAPDRAGSRQAVRRRLGLGRPRGTRRSRPGAPKDSAAPDAPRASPPLPGGPSCYEAELTLKVADLSAATKRALAADAVVQRLRAQRRVRLGHGARHGGARPARSRSGASRRRSCASPRSARILDQHVSIQDVQPRPRRALPADAGPARRDHEAPGAPREPGSDRRRALGARGPGSSPPAGSWPRSSGRRPRAAPGELRDRLARAAQLGGGGRRPARARPHRPCARIARRSILLEEAKVARLRAGRRRAVPGARGARSGCAAGAPPSGGGASARYFFLTGFVVTPGSWTVNVGLISLIFTGADQVISLAEPGTYGSIPRTRYYQTPGGRPSSSSEVAAV